MGTANAWNGHILDEFSVSDLHTENKKYNKELHKSSSARHFEESIGNLKGEHLKRLFGLEY